MLSSKVLTQLMKCDFSSQQNNLEHNKSDSVRTARGKARRLAILKKTEISAFTKKLFILRKNIYKTIYFLVTPVFSLISNC